MAESDMRGRVIEGLYRLDAASVENRVGPGTPDVNYVEGWVELKWRRAWPKKPETPVTVDHFTPEQKVWLRKRWRRGGGVFLLLQVRREWLLFTGPVAAEVLGHSTRRQLVEAALRHWPDGINWSELEKCLQRSSESESPKPS